MDGTGRPRPPTPSCFIQPPSCLPGNPCHPWDGRDGWIRWIGGWVMQMHPGWDVGWQFIPCGLVADSEDSSAYCTTSGPHRPYTRHVRRRFPHKLRYCTDGRGSPVGTHSYRCWRLTPPPRSCACNSDRTCSPCCTAPAPASVLRPAVRRCQR
jgi:hypothetical protein